MKKTLRIATVLLSTLALTACKTTNEDTFGNFGYKGIFLKEYATKQITVDQAKELVDIPPSDFVTQVPKRDLNRADANNVQTVLSEYASLVTTVKYYVSEQEEQQVRQDLYQGTDFKHLLEENYYEPFAQMSIRYIFVDDSLLDDMEQENADFKASYAYYITPFNEPYTFHTNDDKNLIIQIHSFAELPASVGGGIGATFRQDSELIFDEEGKITFWQSSLGLYTSTPTGTVKEGYIFEVQFEWNHK